MEASTSGESAQNETPAAQGAAEATTTQKDDGKDSSSAIPGGKALKKVGSVAADIATTIFTAPIKAGIGIGAAVNSTLSTLTSNDKDTNSKAHTKKSSPATFGEKPQNAAEAAIERTMGGLSLDNIDGSGKWARPPVVDPNIEGVPPLRDSVRLAKEEQQLDSSGHMILRDSFGASFSVRGRDEM